MPDRVRQASAYGAGARAIWRRVRRASSAELAAMAIEIGSAVTFGVRAP